MYKVPGFDQKVMWSVKLWDSKRFIIRCHGPAPTVQKRPANPLRYEISSETLIEREAISPFQPYLTLTKKLRF